METVRIILRTDEGCEMAQLEVTKHSLAAIEATLTILGIPYTIDFEDEWKCGNGYEEGEEEECSE